MNVKILPLQIVNRLVKDNNEKLHNKTQGTKAKQQGEEGSKITNKKKAVGE